MVKVLIKKQLRELYSPFVIKKNGDVRSRNELILFGFLFIMCLFSFGSLFYLMASTIAKPMIEMGLGWLVFAIMGLIMLGVSCLVSAFGTYNGLYKAKDNDLLMSLPLREKDILFARMATLCLLSLLFDLCVIVPSIICYQTAAGFDLKQLLCAVVLWAAISLIGFAFACVIGWIIAIILSKIGNKSFFTVIVSLVFMGGYFYLNSNLQGLFEGLAQKAGELGEAWNSSFNPLYWIGMAGIGDIVSTLLIAGIAVILCAAVYNVLSRGFIRLSTANKGSVRKAYKLSDISSSGIGRSLLRNELRHLFNTPAYMLNCGLGSFFMIGIAVMLIIKRDALLGLLAMLGPDAADISVLIGTVAVCAAAAMCDYTSPSVSLEAKTIWILKSTPVDTAAVLRAKVLLHLIMTSLPAIVLSAVVIWIFRISGIPMLLLLLSSQLFVLFTALLGLFFNLLLPNFTWANETVCVKQSGSVLAAMFGSLIIAAILFAPYFLIDALGSTPAETYLAVICSVLAVLSAAGILWLRTEGIKRFNDL